ncbi:MAG TPA: chorismate synthase [Dongiaceae bacterium]|jgi:chorismate synthase|nr:chorismate synthase [Dongiaceae bacterium]
MSLNSFGRLFRVTTWGESHGAALGCVIDGCPAGVTLSERDIQPALDRRRPGTSRYVTQRQESDTVRILSGVYEGVTTGTPIALEIPNEDQRSKDYAEIARKFRPNHADFTYWVKYGHRDPRGGGRSSARETAVRVAAGAVARTMLGHFLPRAPLVRGALVQIGAKIIDRQRWDWAETARNPFFCPDALAAQRWAGYLERVRKAGDSVGAIVEIQASRVPAGWGAPIYGKLDADLAAAMMGINAVKGVEIGDGFAAARAQGSLAADEMRPGPRKDAPRFLANHAGGILGGISSGQDIVVRFAVKPTSSIPQNLRTVDQDGKAAAIRTKGRHDPCVGIRAVPVGEAMMHLVLADHFLLHRAARPVER